MANQPGSRRGFIIQLAKGIAGNVLIQSTLTGSSENIYAMETKETYKGPEDRNKKLGIALVGLGKYSSEQLAPALQKTEHCYLAGIVTGTPQKEKEWQLKYDIDPRNIYNYTSFDSIKNNPAIDIVYVVLPNALHAEYVIRAAKAGKHVICEKPMALTVEDCDLMIAASKQAGKKLSIGYRLHFEPHNLEMMRLGQQKVFGAIRRITAKDGMADVEGWRLDKKLAGGGPLMDVGIYCVQATRYVTGLEPIAVTAQQGSTTLPDRFKNIEQSLTWQMEFPGGIIAECECSYAEDMNLLHADAAKGWFELKPAYEYTGIKGRTSEGEMNFPQVVQQAKQMDDFALCIKENRSTPVPGEMGRQDLKILQAIYHAMETGKKVAI